jgi:hypothetical protein
MAAPLTTPHLFMNICEISISLPQPDSRLCCLSGPPPVTAPIIRRARQMHTDRRSFFAGAMTLGLARTT